MPRPPGWCHCREVLLRGVKTAEQFAVEEERERFFWYDVVTRANLPSSLKAENRNGKSKTSHQYMKRQYKWLQKHHNWTSIKYGSDVVSSSAVSFHMVKPAIKMKRYERLIYRMKNNNNGDKDCAKYYRKQEKNTSITISSTREKLLRYRGKSLQKVE